MTEGKSNASIMEQVADMFGRFVRVTLGRAEEVRETVGRIETFDNWCREFSKVARRYEVMASGTEDKDAKVQAHLLAAAYYHIGQLLVFTDTEEKREAYDSVVSNYMKAMKYFANHTERVEILFGATTLPGYFRKRESIEKAPCVLLIGGGDSSKEVEPHLTSEELLARGLFTLTFDGPGQGESRFRGMHMRPDFDKAASAALDYLEKRPEVDSQRIGILGPSFGGYLAPRSAALDKRVKACVSLGGFYSLDEFEWHPRVKPIILNIMGITDPEEWSRERKRYTLEGVIDKISCPLLVVNGSEDIELPVSQSKKIYERAGGPKELKIYEGAVHCASDRPEARVYVVDWMADKLKWSRSGSS